MSDCSYLLIQRKTQGDLPIGVYPTLAAVEHAVLADSDPSTLVRELVAHHCGRRCGHCDCSIEHCGCCNEFEGYVVIKLIDGEPVGGWVYWQGGRIPMFYDQCDNEPSSMPATFADVERAKPID